MIRVYKHHVDLKGEPLIHRSVRNNPGVTIRLPGNRTLHIGRR